MTTQYLNGLIMLHKKDKNRISLSAQEFVNEVMTTVMQDLPPGAIVLSVNHLPVRVCETIALVGKSITN